MVIQKFLNEEDFKSKIKKRTKEKQQKAKKKRQKLSLDLKRKQIIKYLNKRNQLQNYAQ